EQDFFDRCDEYFDARVSGLDFSQGEAVKDTVNNWVEENTNGRIKDILKNVHPLAVMYLVNAIYFNGTWTYQFDEEDTKEDVFYLRGDRTKECEMMEVKSQFKYCEDSNAQAIDIPYGNDNYSMTVILPGYGKDIEEFVAGLTQEKWNEWMGSFYEDSVNLFLPKLKLEYKAGDILKKVLIDMGMGVAFDEGLADFTEMYSPGDIFINKVIHKTFLEVDEEGTEAAAATVVEIIESSIPEHPTVYLNRPFVFAIRENYSGSILFLSLLILICTSGCNLWNSDEPLRELSSSERELIEADNSFGLKLFKEINSRETDSNVFTRARRCSPPAPRRRSPRGRRSGRAPSRGTCSPRPPPRD
ncbi:MAG: serpin family protein, partial [candidate division WOR-3 bacterium]